MAEHVAYLNGQFVPESAFMVPVSDRGFRMGDVVFDVERTFDGKVFRLREHLERFYRSLTYVRIDSGLTLEEMEDLTLEVVKRNEPLREPGGDYWVTQFATRGSGVRVTDEGPATVGIHVHNIDFTRYARHYQAGAHVVFPARAAIPPSPLIPR